MGNDPIKPVANIVWHEAAVTRAMREARNGHKGATLWFTGLSGSGKSTLGNAVSSALFARGAQTYVLDGDNVRHGLNRGLTFSPEDRTENVRRIAEVAKLMNDAGLITIAAFVSPYRADRDAARAIASGDFVEVYVKASVEVCASRDPKGLYKKALAGEITGFTGVSKDAPYEAPLNPEVTVDTGELPLADCVARVLEELERRGIVAPINPKH